MLRFAFILIFIHCVYAEEFSKSELSVVNEVVQFVKKNTVKDDIKDEEITAGMLKGALETLDSHSTYFTKDEYKKLSESIGGSFAGIGVYIEVKDGLIHISGVIKGMPAEKSGIKNGDYITHIDGKTTFGFSLEDASAKLRGKKKSTVKLKILREGEKEQRDFVIKRDDIFIETVSMQKIDDILYISIGYFTEHTFKQFEKLIKNQKDYKGIILDMRSNPGGVLDNAIAISSMFLKNGDTIVQVSNVAEMKQKDEKKCIGDGKYCRNVRYIESGKNIAIVNDEEPWIPLSIPMVVLVDSYSASASEITALAMQKNKRAIIVGQKTFGKGSVQSVIPLKNGERGALKLTTALYFDPNGESIQAKGITPNIIIPEFVVKQQEKKESFFPKSEAEYKNHIKYQEEKNNSAKKNEVPLEDFGLQNALTSLKTLILQNGNNS